MDVQKQNGLFVSQERIMMIYWWQKTLFNGSG
jgi:hypothetical protein